MMKFRVELEVSDDDDRELRSLRRWLLGDRSLAGVAEIDDELTYGAAGSGSDSAGGHDGEMGLALEAVLATVSTLAAAGQLGVSIAQWRESRRPKPPVTVIVVEGRPKDAEPILRELRRTDGAEEEPG